MDEFEYNRQEHLRSEAYKNNNEIFSNEETADALTLPDHLKHLFLENPLNWNCEKCSCENLISKLNCYFCNTEIVHEIPDNFKNCKETKTAEISNEFIDDEHDVVPNGDELECSVCQQILFVGAGVVLRDCIHSFCKECLSQHIINNLNSEIKCPFNQDYTCDSNLQDREIKGIVGQEIYDAYLAKCAYEIKRDVNIFRCRKENCDGYGYCVDGSIMNCPICSSTNCTICREIHNGMKCDEFLQKNDKNFKKVEKKGNNKKANLKPASRPTYTIPAEDFYCKTCANYIQAFMGVFIEKCNHSICLNCLKSYLLQANKRDVKCPINNCDGFIEVSFGFFILNFISINFFKKKISVFFDS